MTNRKELYQSDLDAMVNYGKFFMFFIITTPRLILSIIGLIFALLPFLLPVLPYQYDRFIIGILFLYMVSPLILIPCISNIIAYLIHNKKLQNKYLFNRFFTLGLMYLLTLFLSFLIYSLFYASRGDPFISYYMTWFLIMLLIYGLIYTSLSHKLFPRVSGITRLWTDEDFIVPLTIPI